MGSKEIKQYFYRDNEFNMLSLCFAETLSMLKVKYLYRKEIPKKKYFSTMFLLKIYCDDNKIKIHEVEISFSSLVSCCQNLINRHKIDFIDAFQLHILKDNPNSFLITADDSLKKAARSEKINAWNCLKEKVPAI